MELPLLTLILFLLITSSFPQSAVSSPHNNFTDLSSLLAFKAQITDPLGILASNWTTNTSLCHWTGVYCSSRHQRVAVLNLFSFSLQGTISPHLANLSFLSYLDLSNNTLTGSIPEALFRLPRLTKFILERNKLSGPIPSNIFNMSSLTHIYFASNNFSGPIPSNQSLIALRRLQRISLSANQLTGMIPSSFARCRYLQRLSLSRNRLSGNIPAKLGNLPELRVLYLGGNHLSGMIPISLGNLTKLNILDISQNSLEGGIPQELGGLQNLQSLNLAISGLTGPIPIALSNASMLNILELSENHLTGSVPATFGMSMPFLTILHLGVNGLTGGLDFITSLSNCRDLKYLDFSHNELDGVLPDSVGNLSIHLLNFAADTNHIKGEIPAGLGNLSSLLSLNLGSNEMTGVIPAALTRLKRLEAMYLDTNRLYGSIPLELGLLTSLSVLTIQENALSGPIPGSVGNVTGLQQLSLAANKLSSSIPQSLWSLTGLIDLYLNENILDGLLPLQVGNLKVLDTLDLSVNRLSGNISSALGELQMLTYLDLSNNSFHGQIPPSLGGLISVKYLNLSYNDLSGTIPKSLANLRYLESLDLSFNKLEGQIPEGRVFSNLTNTTLIGNVALCGAPQLGFSLCSTNVAISNSKKRLQLLKYILPAIGSIVVIIFACFCLLLTFRRKRKAETMALTATPCLNGHRVISYHELVRATENFSDANLLGRGSSGLVFRGCLDDGLITAVKVLNLEVEGAARSFDTECQALSRVRHRNLIKIISVCSNLDFKALVLQYMPNGSLEQWLYCQNYCLDLLQRINIMVDVSLALEYLHHHYPHVVVHGDLKPSNVLLDENMIAHVGDFGIAKLLLGDSRSVASASTPGTFGYMAPEYGYTGIASRRGDIYSFGILLLETFTRKKPSDAMFDEESNLRQWVCKTHPIAVLEIVDSNLLKDDYIKERPSEDLIIMHRCLSSIIELGLLCSRDSPKERILMKDVVPRLQKIKKEYLSQFPSD